MYANPNDFTDAYYARPQSCYLPATTIPASTYSNDFMDGTYDDYSYGYASEAGYYPGSYDGYNYSYYDRYPTDTCYRPRSIGYGYTYPTEGYPSRALIPSTWRSNFRGRKDERAITVRQKPASVRLAQRFYLAELQERGAKWILCENARRVSRFEMLDRKITLPVDELDGSGEFLSWLWQPGAGTGYVHVWNFENGKFPPLETEIEHRRNRSRSRDRERGRQNRSVPVSKQRGRRRDSWSEERERGRDRSRNGGRRRQSRSRGRDPLYRARVMVFKIAGNEYEKLPASEARYFLAGDVLWKDARRVHVTYE